MAAAAPGGAGEHDAQRVVRPRVRRAAGRRHPEAGRQDVPRRPGRRGLRPGRVDGGLPGRPDLRRDGLRRHRRVPQAEAHRRGRAADEGPRPGRPVPRRRRAGRARHRPRRLRRADHQRRQRAGLRPHAVLRHPAGLRCRHGRQRRPVQLRVHRRRPDRDHHQGPAGGAGGQPAHLRRPAGRRRLVLLAADRPAVQRLLRPGHPHRAHHRGAVHPLLPRPGLRRRAGLRGAPVSAIGGQGSGQQSGEGGFGGALGQFLGGR